MLSFFIKITSHSGTHISLSSSVVAKSVAVFLGIPLVAAIITRIFLRNIASPRWYDQVFLKWMGPWSLI
jgi:ACR3 family arsenite transporter